MFDLSPRSNYTALLQSGHFGRTGQTGLAIRELGGLSLVSLIARKGQAEALRSALEASLHLALPTTPRRIGDDKLAFVWSGPEQWLAAGQSPTLLKELAAIASPFAALTDQGDGRAVLRVSGPNAHEILRKGVTIDLHPSAFKPGDAALTGISHISAHLWQVDDAPTYDIAVARSFAGSFWHWLSVSAAEFGYEVQTP